MEHARVTFVAMAVVSLGLLAHCSSQSDATAPEKSAGADSGVEDGNAPDAPSNDASVDAETLAAQKESEPNDGDAVDGGAQTNTMTLPGVMTGAIQDADDKDLFSIAVAPGELWSWELRADASSFVPHLIVFDTTPANLNPTVAAKGAAATDVARLDHFVLGAGTFLAGVRDARNLPAASSAHVGAPNLTYRLIATKKTVNPTSVTLPSTVTGALAYVGNVAIYTFSANAGTNVDLVVNAKRKAAPSALDSRLTLFAVASKTALLTNDDLNGSTTDSEIHGPLPSTGTYYVVLENVADMASTASVPDLSFEISLATH